MRVILPKSDEDFRKILNLFRNYLSKSALINKTRRFFGKVFIARGLEVGDTTDVPLMEERVSDFEHNVRFGAAEPVACSVSAHSGVYYAQLYVPGHAEPMMVALHGVTSDLQAAQALESFARLRAGEGDEMPVAA